VIVVSDTNILSSLAADYFLIAKVEQVENLVLTSFQPNGQKFLPRRYNGGEK